MFILDASVPKEAMTGGFSGGLSSGGVHCTIEGVHAQRHSNTKGG